jgi:hypothetical protein
LSKVKTQWNKYFNISKRLIPIGEKLQPDTIYGQWKTIKIEEDGKWLCRCTLCDQIKVLNSTKLREGLSCCKCNLVERRGETLKERYQVSNPSQSHHFKKQRQQTMFNKFGYESVLSSPEIKEKIKQTNLERYGVERPSILPQVKKKAKETLLKKGKLLCLSTGEPISEYCKERQINLSHAYTILSNNGEEAFLKYCDSYTKQIGYSDNECTFATIMKDVFPSLEKYDKKPLECKELNYRPDFRLQVGDKVVYVNVDGLYMHSEKTIHQRISQNNYYHKDLRDQFSQNQLDILQFRSNELRDSPQIVKSIVLSHLGIYNRTIDARNCAIRKVEHSILKTFLAENHLMGPMISTGFGLYYQNQLVSVISVKKIEKDNKIILEISRFCTLINTKVRGGFSRLLQHVEQLYDPDCIVSFCDLRYGTGKVYSNNQFELISTTLGWQWTDYKNVFNRLQCRANMDDRGLSQEQHATELGWHKIFDAGQAKYVKKIRDVVEIDTDEEVVRTPTPIAFWSEEENNIIIEQIRQLKNDLSIVTLAIKLKQFVPTKDARLIKVRLKQLAISNPEIFFHQFGYLKTIEPIPSGDRIKCECVCGKQYYVLKGQLIQSRTKSCGCKKSRLCSKPKTRKQ